MRDCFQFVLTLCRLFACSVRTQQCLWGHCSRGPSCRSRQCKFQHWGHQHHSSTTRGRMLRRGNGGRHPHKQQVRHLNIGEFVICLITCIKCIFHKYICYLDFCEALLALCPGCPQVQARLIKSNLQLELVIHLRIV